ncbi:hypothetical protein AEYBE204_09455 [Asticcacaulis sp. YBE204]|nr:hypothetical protein AEYBE204_09455 [Asticcacaulis sp. YBE204]
MGPIALSSGAVHAQTQTITFNIAAQPLDQALFAYSSQSGQQVIYDGGVISGKMSRALKGTFTRQQALSKLLEGTNLKFRVRPSGVAILYAAADVELPAPAASNRAPAQTVDPEPTVVIVTATKRPRNLQRVPMAVSAVKTRSFEVFGTEQVEELTKVVPALTVIQGDTPANSAYILRGIGTVTASIAAEPSVLVQVDDVPSLFQARSFVDLTDVERIEILRGPQNTLYGRSSTGGTISIITAGPTQVFSAASTGTVTSDAERRLAFHTSGPIGKHLFVRVAGNLATYDGAAENLTLGERVNGYESGSVRAKVLWAPSRRTQALLSGWYNHNRSRCCVSAYVSLADDARLRPDGGLVSVPQSVFATDIVAAADNRTIRQDTRTFADLKDGGLSLKFEQIFGEGYRLTSVTSISKFTMSDQVDADGGELPNFTARQVGSGTMSQSAIDRLLLVEPRFGDFLAAGNVQLDGYAADGKTQELRFLSQADALRYMVGVFLSDNEVRLDSARGPAFGQYRWNALARSKDTDLFGQVDWTFRPEMSLSLGVRSQHKTYGYRFEDMLANRSWVDRRKDNSTSVRLSVQRISDAGNTIYLALATGHKAPAFDLSNGFDQARADRGPVRAEEARSIETGWKVRNSSRSYAYLSVFRVDYDDFQSQSTDYATGQTYLDNVDKVRTQGIEFDAYRLMNPYWRITFTGHYLDARIVDYRHAPCYPGQTVAQDCRGTPGRQDLTDRQLPHAPRWKFNLMNDYNLRPNPRQWLVLSGAYRWQSATLMAISQDPNARQEAFGVLDLSAGLHDVRGKYAVTAFLSNVFDTFFASARQSEYRTQPLSVVQVPARDSARSFGIRVMMSY